MKLELIEPIADSLIAQLSRACVRISVAGSIRRRKPEPNDIELVAIPVLGQYGIHDLWGTIVKSIPIDHLADALETLLDLGEWELDPVTPRNGPHYKRLRHVATGVCADLFITDRRRWGVIATIRTGPGDFSKALVSYAHGRGLFVQAGLLHGHPPLYDGQGHVLDCPLAANCSQIIETLEEADVFRALGLPWLEPQLRTVERLTSLRTL